MGAGGSTSPVIMIQDPSSGIRANVLELGDGTKALRTTGLVQIEELFGQDGFADTWFAIGTFEDCNGIGSAGDTIRLQIVAGCNPTEFPAIDLTYTVTAADIAADLPEIEVRDNMVNFLNADSVFSKDWKAGKIKGNGIIHISSKYRAEIGERKIVGDFSVTTTGSTFITTSFTTLEQRGKTTSLARDPDDPRVGVLGISGTVISIPGEVGDIYIENVVDGLSGTDPDMRIDGSVTPRTFTLPTSSEKDILIRELRFYGGGNGIKFGQFLSRAGLTNGINVEVKSDNQVLSLPVIKTTEDFKNKFAFGSGSNFRVDVQAGADQFLAVLIFETPFPIRREGTFVVDDYVTATINDDLSSGLSELGMIAFGFEREV